MTLEEFDNLKVGDEVVITGMSNGQKANANWLQFAGRTVKISEDFKPGSPGLPGYWSAATELNGIKVVLTLVWPDEIIFPVKTITNSIKCECGAVKIGIKLHQAGHSAWCPGV